MSVPSTDSVSSEQILNTETTLNSVSTWNKYFTFVAANHKTPVTLLVRGYALLHVAIYNAVLGKIDASQSTKILLVAGAASEVVNNLYPEDSESTARKVEAETRKIIDPENSLQKGRDAAKRVLDYAKTDGSGAPWDKNIPQGPCKWTGSDPVGPTSGNQKTIFLSSATEIQIPDPFPCGSPQDLQEIQAVIDASNKLTGQQIVTIHKWADLPPPTLWNNMLNNRISNRNMGIVDAARASAYTNCAMYEL